MTFAFPLSPLSLFSDICDTIEWQKQQQNFHNSILVWYTIYTWYRRVESRDEWMNGKKNWWASHLTKLLTTKTSSINIIFYLGQRFFGQMVNNIIINWVLYGSYQVITFRLFMWFSALSLRRENWIWVSEEIERGSNKKKRKSAAEHKWWAVWLAQHDDNLIHIWYSSIYIWHQTYHKLTISLIPHFSFDDDWKEYHLNLKCSLKNSVVSERN